MPLWRGVVALALAAPVRGASLRPGSLLEVESNAQPNKPAKVKRLNPRDEALRLKTQNVEEIIRKQMTSFNRDEKFWREVEDFKNEEFNILYSKDRSPAQQYLVGNHEVLKHWVGGIMGILNEKVDVELRECCAKAKEWQVLPWSHYGRANEEQIKWWEDNLCSEIVGATEPGQVIGLPKCEPSRAVNAIMTDAPAELQPSPAIAFNQEQGMPNCTEKDRAAMNATFLDRDIKSYPLRHECMPPNIVIPNKFFKETMKECIKEALHLESTGCSTCFADLVDDMNNNCFERCVKLGGYGSVQMIKDDGKDCTRCVWPHFQKHQRCLGGSIERPITWDDLIHRVIAMGRGPA